MYKILIADDEPTFRDYLRQLLDWEYYGFEICAEARDGVEALEMASNNMPHVALLDINMPLIDGITLAEKLMELCKDIFIVLITGHSEFEYARKALKLGVEDYILKPFTKDELLSTLIKLKVKLQKIREDEAQANGDASFLKERFLNTLIGDDYNVKENETARVFQRLGMEISSSVFTVSTIEIDNMYQMWNEASEISLWKFAIANMLNEIIESEGTHLVFNGPEGRIVSIINFKDEKEAKKFEIEPYKRLCRLVRENFNFTVTIGTGRPALCFKDIRKAYMESVLALQNKLVKDCGMVIEYDSLADSNWKTGFYRIELNDKILMALRVNGLDEVKCELAKVFNYIKENNVSVDFAYTILMGLVSICLSYITEIGGNIENVFGTDFSPYTEIRNKISLETAFNWLEEIYKKTLENFGQKRATRSQEVVENVKEYIRHNYMNSDLSAENIARSIYLDSSYIRKLFAKEMETSVTDYIAGIRMQKARELLNSESIKLSEISEKVGYSDPGYFSKCFKKYFGISPTEYLNTGKISE